MVQIVNPLENAVVLLQDFGFFTVILPFVLLYALVFGLLMKVKLLGEDDAAKTVNQIIALSVGAFFITSTDAVNYIAGIIPQAGFLLVVVLLIMMVLTLLGLKNPIDNPMFSDKISFGKNLFYLAIVLVFLLVIDMGVPSGIPFIRPLSEFLVGASAVSTGEGFETILSLALVLGFPLAVIYMLGKSASTSPKKDE